MDFAKTLKAAHRRLAGGRARWRPATRGHLGSSGAAGAGGAKVAGELLYATPSQTNLDRNTVDMDRERAAFADNTVRYEATLRFINGHVRTMLSAIKGE